MRDPRAFLFDEPLSNLDAALRVQMRIEIAKLHNALDGGMREGNGDAEVRDKVIETKGNAKIAVDETVPSASAQRPATSSTGKDAPSSTACWDKAMGYRRCDAFHSRREKQRLVV